ncbi:MAG TPA: glycosyltransferase [Pseudobacteroides sp.]|uniref:MGDG synthase family glycosyltransferase n=1 Tax=Pseudobacteroides sp. TaxID=1968840 RepID=UPI002F95F4FB
MKILILTVSAGAGHIKAAEAISEQIKLKYPDSNIMIIDTYKYISPLLDRIIVGGYLSILKMSPRIYDKYYSLSEPIGSRYNFGSMLNRFLAIKLMELIDEFNPSVIACTNFIPLQILSTLHKKSRLKTPTISVITDYTTHSYWVHEYVSAYVVANDFIKTELINKGISSDIIHPLGIPVGTSFYQNNDKHKLLSKYGMKNKPTILIMGGSLGFGNIKNTFLSLLKLKRDIQIVVITGTNNKLRSQLERYSKNSEKCIHIIGYTDKISDYMEMSDILITKPGGMTVSEALTKNIPLLLISPIPGQEERNAQFLSNIGAAARAIKKGDLENILHQLIDNPLRMCHMKEMAKFLAKPDATEKIAGLLAEMSLAFKEEHSHVKPELQKNSISQSKNTLNISSPDNQPWAY